MFPRRGCTLLILKQICDIFCQNHCSLTKSLRHKLGIPCEVEATIHQGGWSYWTNWPVHPPRKYAKMGKRKNLCSHYPPPTFGRREKRRRFLSNIRRTKPHQGILPRIMGWVGLWCGTIQEDKTAKAGQKETMSLLTQQSNSQTVKHSNSQPVNHSNH